MTEQWLPVIGFEGLYEVSDHGSVRSIDRAQIYVRLGQEIARNLKGRTLRPGKLKSGHLLVVLQKRTRLVHHLVLEAFVGPRPIGQESCHGDGNPSNNFWKNLRWGTRADNVQDSIRHGTKPRGSNHKSAILTENDIPTIRERCKSERCKDVARDYRVSRGAIQGIRDGVNWKHVP